MDSVKDGNISSRRANGGARRARGAGAGHSQSLIRGLRILEVLADAPPGLTLTDLSQTVGLAPSTAHRLLRSLEQREFVEQDPELGIWHVGVRTFSVGSAYLAARDVVAETRPFLRRLAEETGETANLAVEDDGCAVFLAQSESQQMMRMIVKLGSRAPLHASGVGKALLAALPRRRVELILQNRGPAVLTANTLDAPAKLWAELEQIRRRGYACDLEEHAVGLRCVAATVHDERGLPVAAISVSGPHVRIPDRRLAELGNAIADAARRITDRLGGVYPPPPDG